MTFEDTINVPDEEYPDAISNFNDLDEMDNYGNEFAQLINYIGEMDGQIGKIPVRESAPDNPDQGEMWILDPNA